ncbi:helix-hairpin-helix domain-containing protein [Sphingomonas sp. ID1715]|uniref:helix-hairpin-helix domain-containing protein n=1 Tax=Sphingomonas sp. ID1715 TaxID=1656898 RepID=UPI0034A04EEB
MMDWLQQNWILLVLGAAVALVALWWLIGSSASRSPEATTRDGVEQEISPVITGPATAPIDVPPPVDAVPPTAEPEILPEPEALVQPIHAIAAGPPDELTRMKGVGPKVAALLNGLGVTRYDQIASWSDDDIARIDAQLGAFKGRITRDQWVEQARLLAASDRAGYEAKFGKLG